MHSFLFYSDSCVCRHHRRRQFIQNEKYPAEHVVLYFVNGYCIDIG